MTILYNAKSYRDIREKRLIEHIKVGTDFANQSRPNLTVIQVGNSAESDKYVGNKAKACKRVGIEFNYIRLPKSTKQEQLEDIIRGLAYNPDVHGIVLQLPLFGDNLDTAKLIDLIPQIKDVDGLGTINTGLLNTYNPKALKPCTALGVLDILKELMPNNLGGKNAVVIGKGITSGRPITTLLIQNGVNTISLSSKTSPQDLKYYLENADIVISCVGKKILEPKEYKVKKDSIYINVGMHVDEEGKLKGDYVPEEYVNNGRAKYVTSITNSTGILTVHNLLLNTIIAWDCQSHSKINKR